jgi:hypothetical protein
MHESENDRLRRELQEAQDLLASFQTQGTTIRVSQKGGVSVYGLGRYPVTLYDQQWLKLLAMADTIRGFIRENKHLLKQKPAKK